MTADPSVNRDKFFAQYLKQRDQVTREVFSFWCYNLRRETGNEHKRWPSPLYILNNFTLTTPDSIPFNSHIAYLSPVYTPGLTDDFSTPINLREVNKRLSDFCFPVRPHHYYTRSPPPEPSSRPSKRSRLA